MPVNFCPACNQRYVVGFDTTDFVHECNSGNAAIDNEDVVLVGDWEDFSGRGKGDVQGVLMQGTQNQLQGTRAGILGADKEKLTRRGARASTHRQRPHLQYINLEKGGLE